MIEASAGSVKAPINSSCNVQVAVRCRPVNSEERKSGQATVITCQPDTKTVQVSYGPPGKKTLKSFTYDKVFGLYSTQEEVFNGVVKPIVDEALAGFNCTIFAYGQTGTGKTHTMEGDIFSEEHAGIVPRSVKWILEQLENSEAEYTIRVSFLELYNEELQDLLNSSKDKKLKLCEDGVKGVVCQNLEEITVLGATDIFEILQKGIQNRQTAATLCNKNSSRSHSIFTLKIMIKECNVDGEEVVRHGQLNLVDLAGSECVGRSGAKNDRAREAGNINQSLLTLGRVITALVDHHGHIPYRDSKLTRILQESLGGKAKTCIIATLSPSANAVEETLSTLDYAYRAKSIKNQPTVNQRMTKKVVLKEYCTEIENLKSQLMLTREKNGVYVDPAEYYAMEARIQSQESQLNECESVLRQRSDEVKSLKSEKEDLINDIEAKQLRLIELEESFEELRRENEEVKAELFTRKVELKAANAVIDEVTVTEKTLTIQGNSLKHELLERHEDIDKLLFKVDKLVNNESQRLLSTSGYIDQLKQNKDSLMESIALMVKSNTESSGYLVHGVNEILDKSRVTSSSLQKSIFSTLERFINETKTAKQNLQNSCSGLQQDISHSNDHIIDTLTKLNTQLLSWMNSFDDQFNEVKQCIQSQKTQINEYKAAVSHQSAEFTSLNHSYYSSHEAYSSTLIKQFGSFKHELLSTFSKHSSHTKSVAVNAQERLQQQAQAMEDKLTSMIRDLVQSGLQSMTEINDSTDDFTSNFDTFVASMDKQFSQTVTAQNQDTFDFVFGSNEKLVINCDGHLKSAKKLEKTCADMDERMLECGQCTQTFSKESSDGVNQLKGHVSSMMNAIGQQIESTSFEASQVLDKVNETSKSMNTLTSEALGSFTSYLDQHGHVLSSTLVGHLDTISHTVTNSLQPVVETIGKESNDFLQLMHDGKTPSLSEYSRLGLYEAESVTNTQINTPSRKLMKEKYHEVVPIALASTRSHDLIRNEVISKFVEDPSSSSRVVEAMEVDDNDEFGSVTSSTLAADIEARTSTSSTGSSNSTSSQMSSGLGTKKRKVAPSTVVSVDSENTNPNVSSTAGGGKITRGAVHRSKSVVSSSSDSVGVTTRIRSTSMQQDN